MKTEKVKFYVERGSFGVQAMIILTALAVVFRVIGCWGLWNDRSFALLQIALPVFSALLLVLLVWLFGKRALWISFIPVALGAVFFIVRAFDCESKLEMVLCILTDIAVIALYFSTVFGFVRTKWILALLFVLPFLYCVFGRDLAAMRDTANPVTFSAGMQEMGSLCVMLGLFFLALSMKKQIKETEAKLPKIRAPKVLVNPKPAADAEEGEASSAAETEAAPTPQPPSENTDENSDEENNDAETT